MSVRRFVPHSWIWASVLGACSDEAASPGPTHAPVPAATIAGDFPDEAAERGLDYVNRSGEAHKPVILEANGAGVALIDLHADGDQDLVFAQGLASLAGLRSGPGADLEVFVNDGGGRFSRTAGPGLSGWWTGLGVGDLDNDGDQDLVAGGFGTLRVLLQNEGGVLVPSADLMPDDPHARFEPGAAREVGRPPLWVSSLACFDADRDGNLDVYVGHYLELDPLAPTIGQVGEGALAVPCRWKGQEVFCGPHGLVGQKDRLLCGRGDGTFEDVSASWIPGLIAGYTLGVVAFDADMDGDSDLFVANDSVANLLLINDGHGRFVDHAYAAGVALSQDGRALAGMGAAAGDVDRDGLPDLCLTTFSGEATELWFGAARGFASQTYRMGLARETRSLLSWGVHLVDFDGDGWRELVSMNGHVYPQADAPGTDTRYHQAATRWTLMPAGKAQLAPHTDPKSVFASPIGQRGSAVGDLDGDLAPDLVLVRIDAPAALGMNRLTGGGHRLSLRCLGPTKDQRLAGTEPLRTPADGMGTRAVVVPKVESGAREFALLGEVQTSQGFQSASTAWLEFGLGTSTQIESILILWPSGRREELRDLGVDRRIVVREGAGIVSEERRP